MRMPKDDSGTPIPALKLLNPGGAHHITTGTTSARNTTPFATPTPGVQNGQRVISLYSTVDCFIRFGDSNVVATTDDHFYPANTLYDYSVGNESTHLAVILASGTGVMHASERG